jgi:hypothetical protein
MRSGLIEVRSVGVGVGYRRHTLSAEPSSNASVAAKGNDDATMSESTSNGTTGFVLHASGNLHKGTWT